MRRIAAFVLLLGISSSCSLRAPMKRFSTQEEAGTVHVAVQSIAKFDDAYTDQLQPHFDLTSEQALNAISQTQVAEMERMRALLAELNLAGRKRTVTSERTLTKGEVTTETKTEKTEAPDLETVPAAPGAKTLTNTAPDVTTTEKVQLDQSLRYRAAAALIQEIALFNRYVRDAAVSRGTIPYVVRLLVTVNPSARREPYDVYTTISFFSGGEPDYDTEAAELLSYSAYKGGTIAGISTDLRRILAADSCERAVEVIPLFVTDNLESSLNSSANERTIEGSGGASGFFANFAAALGLRGQAIDRDRSLGRGINGLTTISRLGDNTIMARLGAASANNQYEMVARTYNVTLLALVPTTASLMKGKEWSLSDRAFEALQDRTPCSDLAFTGYSKFRDAVRGTEVATSFAARRDRTIMAMAGSWGFRSVGADAALKRLLLLAEMGRYGDFTSAAKAYASGALQSATADLREVSLRNTLWHDLVRVSHVSGRSNGRFQLPERTDRFFPTQEVTLFDDGKKTTVVVNGARNLTSDGLHAKIHAQNVNGEIFVDESGVVISDDRHRATFTFPSLKARMGTDVFTLLKFRADKILSGARGTISTTDFMEDTTPTYRLIEVVKVPEKTLMAVSADSIRVKEGAGEFAVAFTSDKSLPAPAVLLDIRGGTIAGVVPAAPFGAKGLELTGQGNYVITMKNLFAETPVKVRAVLDDGSTVVGEKILTVKP